MQKNYFASAWTICYYFYFFGSVIELQNPILFQITLQQRPILVDH